MSINPGMQRIILAGVFFMTTIGISYAQVNKADIVVAKDGSGNHKTVQAAINAASSGDIILVKPGTYNEKVKISKNNLTLMGESAENTIITCNGGRGADACVYVTGSGFYAENITFNNSMDSRKGGSQAEALNVAADKVSFYKTSILGFQDTYFMRGNNRVYHKNCVIQGTTDFIYGGGIALFDDCTIFNRKDSHVTAHAPSGDPEFGYVFKNCDIKKHPDEKVTNASLGRPWGKNANVVYLNCNIGAHIRPDGWQVWGGRESSAYYAEYKSTGPGANPEKRLSWTHQLTDSEAAKYTIKNIFKDWIPEIKGISTAASGRPAMAVQEQFYTLSKNTVHILAAGINKIDIRIFSLDGKVVLERKILSDNGLVNVTIPVGNLKSGSYLIQSKYGNSVNNGYISLL